MLARLQNQRALWQTQATTLSTVSYLFRRFRAALWQAVVTRRTSSPCWMSAALRIVFFVCGDKRSHPRVSYPHQYASNTLPPPAPPTHPCDHDPNYPNEGVRPYGELNDYSPLDLSDDVAHHSQHVNAPRLVET